MLLGQLWQGWSCWIVESINIYWAPYFCMERSQFNEREFWDLLCMSIGYLANACQMEHPSKPDKTVSAIYIYTYIYICNVYIIIYIRLKARNIWSGLLLKKQHHLLEEILWGLRRDGTWNVTQKVADFFFPDPMSLFHIPMAAMSSGLVYIPVSFLIAPWILDICTLSLSLSTFYPHFMSQPHFTPSRGGGT